MAAKLTVKGRAASAHQLANGRLIVEITRRRGGDTQSAAGAVATSIQESTLVNLRGGDRDSAGLFQQRPSMKWGSYAQVTTPAYAINKFLDSYLVYRKRGLGWLDASHRTQRSAHPSAPARWFSEGMRFAVAFGGSGAGGAASTAATGSSDSNVANAGTTTETTTKTETRVLPYEFSRGNADQRETTWEAARRLADEVQFRLFARGGTIWLASDEYLLKGSPRARLNEFTLGVVKLSFEHETRSDAAEASLTIATRRWALLPGDAIEITDEGAGSGKWLVASVRRALHSQFTEVSLTRKRPILPEPAPQTETITVAETRQVTSGTNAGSGPAGLGSNSPGAATSNRTNTNNGPSIPEPALRVYKAAQLFSSWGTRYDQNRRNGLTKGPFRYADCSSGVSWILLAAGLRLPGGVKSGWAPSTHAYPGWALRGWGRYFTVMIRYAGANAHIWIRFNGMGTAWRFDTGGGSGGRLWNTARSTAGFVAHHWPGC